MSAPFEEKKFLTTKELAVRWGYSPKTLSNMRQNKSGPSFICPKGKRGCRVLYPIEEILKFEAKHFSHSGEINE